MAHWKAQVRGELDAFGRDRGGRGSRPTHRRVTDPWLGRAVQHGGLGYLTCWRVPLFAWRGRDHTPASRCAAGRTGYKVSSVAGHAAETAQDAAPGGTRGRAIARLDQRGSTRSLPELNGTSNAAGGCTIAACSRIRGHQADQAPRNLGRGKRGGYARSSASAARFLLQEFRQVARWSKCVTRQQRH
jgi:hypothetical protein